MPWPNLTEQEMQLRDYLCSIQIKLIPSRNKKQQFLAFSLTTVNKATELRQLFIATYKFREKDLVIKDTLLYIAPGAFDTLANKLGLEEKDKQKPPTIRFKEVKEITSTTIQRAKELVEYLRKHGTHFYKTLQLFLIVSDEGLQFRNWYSLNKEDYTIDVCLSHKKTPLARAATQFTFLLHDLLQNLEIPNTDFFDTYFSRHAPTAQSNILLICLSELYANSCDSSNIEVLFHHNPKLMDAFAKEKIEVFNQMYDDYHHFLLTRCDNNASMESTLSCTDTEELNNLPLVEEISHSKTVPLLSTYNFRKRKKQFDDDTLPLIKGDESEKHLPSKRYRK